jgi:hypothetical protein
MISTAPEFFVNKVSLAVVEIDCALAFIPAGVKHFIRAIAVNIRNGHRRRARRIRQRTAIEMELAVIHTNIARHAAIRDRDIRIAVAVQVPNRCVSG